MKCVPENSATSRKHDKGLDLSGMTLSRMRDRWICGKLFGFRVGSERCGQLAGALDVEVETRSLT